LLLFLRKSLDFNINRLYFLSKVFTKKLKESRIQKENEELHKELAAIRQKMKVLDDPRLLEILEEWEKE